jgi:site-specific DNA recombinase
LALGVFKVNAYGVTVDPERVAVYIRWSTDEQSEGTTLEVQSESCEHYLLAQGWKLREELVFVDEGYSGGSLERPGLSALRKAVKAGRVSCVVVFKLDRLSRSVIDTVNLVLQEWDGLCYVKSTREPVDTTTSAGKMFFYMLASYAEWERSVIKERTMSGKIKRAQQGKNPGFSAPYGYARGDKPGEWVVEPSEAAVVRRVFEEYVTGMGIHSIAAGLHAARIKPRRSSRWYPTTIANMLSNVAYTGVLEYGRTTVAPKALREQVGKMRIDFDEPRYARVEGALPVIISPELFERAQRVHESKAAVQGKRSLSAEFLLAGIARCTCGGTLRGDTRSEKGHRYYRCGNREASHPTPCKAGMIPAPELEAAVVEEIRKAFDPANRASFLGDWEAQTRESVERAEADLGFVRSTLASLAARRQRLDADYDAGDLPAKLYTQRIERLEEEEERLLTSEQEALERLEQLRKATFDGAEFDALATKVDAWEHLSPEEQKQVLRLAVASCTAYRSPVIGRPSERPAPEVSVTIWRPQCRIG